MEQGQDMRRVSLGVADELARAVMVSGGSTKRLQRRRLGSSAFVDQWGPIIGSIQADH